MPIEMPFGTLAYVGDLTKSMSLIALAPLRGEPRVREVSREIRVVKRNANAFSHLMPSSMAASAVRK